jgi:hypothetical protein
MYAHQDHTQRNAKLQSMHTAKWLWGHPHSNKQAIAVTAPCCLKTSNKPRLPTLLTNQWQNGQSSCGSV